MPEGRSVRGRGEAAEDARKGGASEAEARQQKRCRKSGASEAEARQRKMRGRAERQKWGRGSRRDAGRAERQRQESRDLGKRISSISFFASVMSPICSRPWLSLDKRMGQEETSQARRRRMAFSRQLTR